MSHLVDLVAKEIDHIQAKLSRSTICHLGIPRVSPRVSDSHKMMKICSHERENAPAVALVVDTGRSPPPPSQEEAMAL